MTKTKTLNAKQLAVINALRTADKAMTLAEISAVIGEDVKSGTTNTLVASGYIVKAGKVEVEKLVKSKVNVYGLGSVDINSTKLKVTENRVAIIDALRDGNYTLAELSTKIGIDVKSGTTNALVTAGVIVKVDVKTVEKLGKAKVESYKIGTVEVAE